LTGTPPSPYATFLETSDPSTWLTCLDEAIRELDELPPGASPIQALTRALTIAMYVTWVSNSSGDAAAADHGQKLYERLASRLTALSSDAAIPGGPESDTCWGLVIGWSGYRVQGLELLTRHGRPALEHHLICLPEDDLSIVTALREDLGSARGRSFLPAVHVYGSALVNVGAVANAEELVAGCRWPETEPLLAAILGSAAERTGNWSQAHATYRASNWPEHRYRAALTGVVADAGPQQLTLDRPLLGVLGNLESELKQTALIRSAAFLDACLWQPISNWLVELEQGKLCFRRRWHSEADAHFATALSAAPAAARYPVASLRFANLTWLTGEDVSVVDLGPEARTAGRQALALAPDGDDEGSQSPWLAQTTGDTSLIPAGFVGWPARLRAEAWAALGDEPKAVDAYLASLEQSYDHRAMIALIRRLAPAGFTDTTAYLAELVLRESEEDFFALWETAQQLQALSGAVVGDEGLDRPEESIDDRFRARLRELSLLEFKNAVRSIGLFRQAGLHDVAEELLIRAARSAESVSELIAVAELCRPQGGRMGQLNRLGYGCLMRAARESRDRFERFRVAHELFAYGQVASGRAILEEERAFSSDTDLSHAEAVAVLQCATWLPRDRVRAVARAAVERLGRDAHSGVLGVDYRTYADRLGGILASQGIQLDIQIREPSPASAAVVADEPDTTSWAQRVEHISAWVEQADEPDAQGGEDATDYPFELDRSAPRGERLVLAIHLLKLLSEAQAAVRSVRPDAPPETVPVRLDMSGDGVRTVELGDLWRSRLAGPSSEHGQADELLRAFYAREQELDEGWEERLRAAAEDDNRKLVRVCDLLSRCLDAVMGQDEPTAGNPIVRGLDDALVRDVERLQGEIDEAVANADHDLSLTRLPSPGATVST
jgi:hypothetical protein